MSGRRASKRAKPDEEWQPPTGRAGPTGAPAAPRVRRPAVVAPVSGLFLIRCSREGSIIQWDDATFTDCYGSEIDDHEQEVISVARKGSGTWLYGTRTGGSATGDGGGAPPATAQPAVFASLDAANAKAAKLWASMQRNLPSYSWRPARPTGKRVRPLFSSREEEEYEELGEGAAAQAAAAAAAKECTELAGGRKRWSGKRFFMIDPWCDECKNVAACVETVEVVPAAAG